MDSALKPLLWPETKAIVGIDVRSLQKSGIYGRHRAELLPLLERLQGGQLGIDLEHDVSQLSLASNGTNLILFATGHFNRAQIAGRLHTQGARDAKFGTYAGLQNGNSAVVFFRDSAILAGYTDAVRSALKVQDSGKGEVPEQLQSKLAALPADSQLYLVSLGGLPLNAVPLRSDTRTNLANFIGYIKGVSAGVHADDGLHLRSFVDCISPEGTTRVNDALRGIVGLARLSTKDYETDLLKIYDAIHISKGATVVRIDTDLSANDTDRLLSLFQRFNRRF